MHERETSDYGKVCNLDIDDRGVTGRRPFIQFDSVEKPCDARSGEFRDAKAKRPIESRGDVFPIILISVQMCKVCSSMLFDTTKIRV